MPRFLYEEIHFRNLCCCNTFDNNITFSIYNYSKAKLTSIVQPTLNVAEINELD